MTSNGKPKCGGKRAGGAGLCKQPAGWGTDHAGVGRCKRHGGATPTYQQKAKRIMAEEAVAAYGLPVDVSAEQALIDEVCRTAGHVQALGEMVMALPKDQLSWGMAEQTERAGRDDDGEGGGDGGGDGGASPSVAAVVDTKYRASPHVLVGMYRAERKHLIEVAGKVSTLRISERQVALAERQGALMAAMFRGALDDADVPADVRGRIEAAFRQRVAAGRRPTIEGGLS